jgi:hypothetical protein
MSQLTIQLSDRADALVAQLQKEIFQRRRKKVSAEGVIETLIESGAKSQSDKRFATSWKNLVSDIEKAARLADAHGAKPAVLSDEEWALVLSHRSRSSSASAAAGSGSRRKATAATAARTTGAGAAVRKKGLSAKTTGRKKPSGAAEKPSPAATGTRRVRSSVAKRMAKAVNRLGTSATVTASAPEGGTAGNGTAAAEALLS